MADVKTIPKPEAAKRLVVFLDGTTDTQSGNTNVWRLKALCASHDADGVEQKVFYSPGVGTTFGEEVRGDVFGYGIDDLVVAGYEWLVEHYEEKDEIFVFGFSRGAFAARSLSGFISRCGLIRLGAPLGVKQLYDRYRQGNAVLTIRDLIEPGVDRSKWGVEEKWIFKYCLPVDVKFTGVWDTVGAVATSDRLALVTGGDHSFLDVNLRKSEEFAYHAMAIDEHRPVFDVNLFTQYLENDAGGRPAAFKQPRDLEHVEQRWFCGAHGDVGGGSYNDLLAQIPLRWLMGKASSHGLAFRADVEIETKAFLAPIEDTFSDFLKGAYKYVANRNYRGIQRPPEVRAKTTVHTLNETIDVSVFERWRDDADYRPRNLVDWERRFDVDVATLTASVRADDPKVPVPD